MFLSVVMRSLFVQKVVKCCFRLMQILLLMRDWQLTILGTLWIIGQVMDKLLDGIACHEILKDKVSLNGFY